MPVCVVVLQINKQNFVCENPNCNAFRIWTVLCVGVIGPLQPTYHCNRDDPNPVLAVSKQQRFPSILASDDEYQRDLSFLSRVT